MNTQNAPRYLPVGESALCVEFGDRIDPRLHDQVLGLDQSLSLRPIPGILETVPTYRSLLIHFDPHRLTSEDLTVALTERRNERPEPAPPKHWLFPVCYDLPFAEDLAEVASLLDLPPETIIDLHASATYRVYMYGFAPGFTFLGGLPEALGVSRRPTPRPPAPAGSLTIAGGQALITSMAMPTGWYVLGRTPVRVFDLGRPQPFLTEVGDEIRFERINAAAFASLEARALSGDPLIAPR
ncbi:5-oxoprolinase subunit B family protein [Beijerinckia indica]|uniref:Allophanate hydrolase subunit 1 n=1 Tax=Beijerinckia indica subsp. indica (strain ATCC 9039 / DSM 1715 / NCIMB 8712) TaxID=395963 RepID=B2ICA5_BEII9|nr:allophanate hydrolase subunit 1 [Beijerinckia indica]ACB96702.1 Allophanate hydrolase subunit 1 [Beijerinckia indica subsp. indica ATCC 9039]